MPRYKPILERFLEKIAVNEVTQCWEWQGTRVGIGYGTLGGERGGKSHMAHRFSYEHHKGPIPNGMVICHKCDNPGCVNPDHLLAAGHKANMLDMARKGRGRLLSAEEVADIQIRSMSGESLSAIARDLAVSRSTVTRALVAAEKGDLGGSETRKSAGYYTILSEEDRAAVKFAVAEGTLSIMRIARMFNVDRRTVRNIRDGKQTGRYHKITREQAREIIEYWHAGFRQQQIADLYGLDQTQVSRIVRGQSWPGISSTTVPKGVKAKRNAA